MKLRTAIFGWALGAVALTALVAWLIPLTWGKTATTFIFCAIYIAGLDLLLRFSE